MINQEHFPGVRLSGISSPGRQLQRACVFKVTCQDLSRILPHLVALKETSDEIWPTWLDTQQAQAYVVAEAGENERLMLDVGMSLNLGHQSERKYRFRGILAARSCLVVIPYYFKTVSCRTTVVWAMKLLRNALDFRHGNQTATWQVRNGCIRLQGSAKDSWREEWGKVKHGQAWLNPWSSPCSNMFKLRFVICVSHAITFVRKFANSC